MSFLYPLFLLGAIAAAIPIALHFLRRDVAPEVPFSAVRLLHRSPLERSRRRKLRDLLLLAARVAALVLLATAFARPYTAGASGSSAAVRIIAIDRSYSMGSPGRFAAALEIARAAIAEASMTERVALIAFDDRAELIAPPGSASDARAALGALAVGYGATKYGPMLARAADTADGAPGRVIVITDLQRTGWEDQRRGVLPASLQLELRDVGAPPPNVAVTGVRVEKDRLVAVVRNTGPEPRAGRIRAIRDGQEVASGTYSAGADASVDVVLGYRAPSSGALAVSVDDEAGVPADNVRHARLEPAAHPSVLVVTSGSARSGFYFSRALAAASDDAGSAGLGVRVVSGSDVSRFAAAEFDGVAAIVILSTRGLERRAREGLSGVALRGGGVLIAGSPEVEPDVLATMFEWAKALGDVEQPAKRTALAATDLRHPIFRPFGSLAANLGQVRFDRAWRLPPDGWDVAARFTDGSPALLDRPGGTGRIVLLASDVDRAWNDFPLHSTFVPFIMEAVRYVAGDMDGSHEYTVGSLPPGVPGTPGVHALGGPPSAPGGDASRPAARSRTVVVNVDGRESATARMGADEFDALVDRIAVEPGTSRTVRAQQTESRQSYWQYGLLLMLGTLVVESFVGRA